MVVRRWARSADNPHAMDLSLEPTVVGAAFAALAVAGGAPLFTDGLRTLRLRRHFAGLSERRLEEAPTGFIRTHGRVVLDGPLFSPISAKPCAGFRIQVEGGRSGPVTAAEERRSFRIVVGETSARIVSGARPWLLSETARRLVEPGETLSENLAAMLRGSPEVALLRRQGRPIVLVERALLAGSDCHVVGFARHSRPYELPEEMEMIRTGTDDAVPVLAGAAPAGAADPAWVDGATLVQTEPRPKRSGPFGIERRLPGRPFPGDVDLWVDGGGLLDFVLVSDSPPGRDALSISPWRILGLLLGPALSLSGLLYLAHAAERLYGHRGS